jgi:hypothetical protein
MGGLLSVPLTLHPQVCFRLTRVLCILSRKFLALQLRHEAQVAAHNARVEALASLGRETLSEAEEAAEVELEEVAEELGTCMEFIQLLLEVVNHSIVHALPAPHPLAPPSATAAAAMQRHLMSNGGGGGGGGGGSPSLSPDGGILGGNGPFQSSLASNPHLLYNLIVSKEYFTQLLPYAHLFEPHLISNVTNVIAFYERAHGVDLPRRPAGGMVTGGAVVLAEQSGGGRANHASRASEKDVEKCVQALARAVSRTPMHLGSSSSQSPSPNGPRPGPVAGSGPASALPPSSHPSFDPAALIERGPFTYHEQENSQDFFIPYIFQLCQTMRILPRMTSDGIAAASVSPNQTNSPPGPEGSGGGGSNMGDVDADAEYMRELYMEEQAANAAPLGLHEEEEEENDGGDEDDDAFQEDEWTATGNGGRARSGVDRAQTTSPPGDDFSNLRIAIK